MTRPVVVREVEIASFGGINQRGFRFPDHPFVVVSGPNEAGKTTMATVLSWLLAGPTDVARRFGSPNDVLEGVLRGTFGGDIFTSSAAFKVPEAGVPDEAEWRILFRSQLTASGWRAALGGVDSAVVSAIYRLWGADLHDGNVVDEELSRVALGSYGGRIDARNLASQLGQLAQELLAGGAQAGAGLPGIQTERDFLRRQLDDARRSVVEYTTVQREIDAVGGQRASTAAELTALERSVVDFERALGAHVLFVDVRDLEARMSALAPVRDEWRMVARRADDVKRTLAEHEDASARHRSALAAIDDATRSGPLPAAELPDATVTDEQRLDIARRVSSLRGLDASRAAAEERVRHLQSELESASSALNAKLVSLSERGGPVLSREVLASARVDPHASGALLEAAAEWRAAQAAAEQLRPSVDSAQEQLDKLAASRRRSPVPLVLWFLAAGSAVIAGTGVVADARAIVVPAAAAAAVGVLGAAMTSWNVRRSRGVSFDSNFAAARRDVAVNTDMLRQAELAVMRAQQNIQRLAVEFGHQPPSHPNAVAPTLILWTEAADLLTRERSADAALGNAQLELLEIERGTTAHEEEVRVLMRGCGLPDHVPLRSADEAVAMQQRVGLLRSEAAATERALADVAARLDGLLSPVAPEVRGWSPEQLTSELSRVSEHLAAEERLAERLTLARRDLGVATDGRPDIVGILEAHPDRDDLEKSHARAVAQAADLGERLRSMSERAGQLAERLRELDLKETLSFLVARDGTLAEQQRDLVAEAVATAVASTLLRQAVEDYVRTHQPAIVARTSELVRLIAPAWESVEVALADPDADGPSMALSIRSRDGRLVPSQRLSTGARALLYLALRVAMADHDGDQRGIAFPMICDDPLVHMDDSRAAAAVAVLAEAATRRQVFLMTCHERTVRAATAAGAEVLQL